MGPITAYLCNSLTPEAVYSSVPVSINVDEITKDTHNITTGEI
jgi:hypothetical protein